MYHVRGGVRWYCTFVSISVIMMSWSDIPGTFTEDFTHVKLDTKTRSSVGVSCICVRLFDPMTSASPCWISLSGPVAVCRLQFISGQLKSPVIILFVVLCWSMISNGFFSSSRCFCSLWGMQKVPISKSLLLLTLILTICSSPSVINSGFSTEVIDFSTRIKTPPPSVPLSFLYTM